MHVNVLSFHYERNAYSLKNFIKTRKNYRIFPALSRDGGVAARTPAATALAAQEENGAKTSDVARAELLLARGRG